MQPGPARRLQHCQLDTGYLQDARRNMRMGKGMYSVSPTEIKDLLANNGTIANINTEAISASIC